MAPLGGVLLTGPGGPNLYFKGLIEKLAINVEVFRVGAFKSAVEPFTRSDQSPEAEGAAQALVNTIWSVWKGDVARARPRAKIESYIDALPQQVAAPGGGPRKGGAASGVVAKLGRRAGFARLGPPLCGRGSDTRGHHCAA